MQRAPGILAVWLCAAVAACQGSPTAPGGTPSPEAGMLPAGRYLLTVATEQPQDPSCTGHMEAWGLFGPTIGAFISLSARGDAWVGRLEAPSDATLELQIPQGSDAPAAPTITGTLRGTMVHFLDALLSRPARTASFGGPDANGSVPIDATLLHSRFLKGTASGGITFNHPSGTAVACPQATLTLS